MRVRNRGGGRCIHYFMVAQDGTGWKFKVQGPQHLGRGTIFSGDSVDFPLAGFFDHVFEQDHVKIACKLISVECDKFDKKVERRGQNTSRAACCCAADPPRWGETQPNLDQTWLPQSNQGSTESCPYPVGEGLGWASLH